MEIVKPVLVTQVRYLQIHEDNAFIIPLLEPLFAIPTHATYEERVRVFESAMSLKRGFVACEVGCYLGASTAMLAAAASVRLGRVHAVDTWQNQTVDGEPLRDTFPEFSKNTQTLRQHIEVHRGFSHDLCGEIPKLDLLLIDGDHSYEGASADLADYVPKIVPGGLLLIHDYNRDTVKQATEDYFKNKPVKDQGMTHSLQVFQILP